MKQLLMLMFAGMMFSACNKPEDVPAYIYIKPFVLNTDQATEGEASSKITEGWVYFNNNLIGAYAIPGEVPVPSTGKTDIVVFPMVKNNGSSATPAIYTFYSRYDATLNLSAGKTDTIYPRTSYVKDLVFAWLEDFETKNSLNLIAGADTANTFRISTTGVKYGKKCGLFQVTGPNDSLSVTTATTIKDIPYLSSVYLEVDYQGSAALRVDLVGNSINGTKGLEYAAFQPKTEWNKAYIKFRFKDYDPKQYPSFNFIFSAQIPVDGNGKQLLKKADLRIDNIKLVYPK